MNKRTIILIAICCLLAVVTLTARYIEQEIEIIKAQFVGDKQAEERTSRGAGSARQATPGTQQAEKALRPMRQEAAVPPASGGIQQAPAETAVPGSASRGMPVSAGRKAVNTTTPVAPNITAAEKSAAPVRPETIPIEDVTTPLGPEAGAESRESVPGSERAGGADAQDGAAPAEDEKKEPAAEADNAGDAAAPAVVEEKSGQATEGSGIDEKSAAATESDTGAEVEVTGEGAAAVDEEAVEEEIPAEEEAAPGEGEADEAAEEGADEE